jgi:hypothetical protein
VTNFRACSSPAPTPVKPQLAPAILSQESVHTTLSITHHTRKRRSTGPRTTHGPHNGSEFRNTHFKTFCHDLGLEHQFCSPYTPPQNGMVERKNRTLCEMARAMLDEHRTPRRSWAEAVHTACYVSNRIYLRVYKKKTCYELMHSRTPMVSHFHIFCCKCFILKKGKKLDKFDARSVNGIFLVMHFTLEHIVCSILKLTKSWRPVR